MSNYSVELQSENKLVLRGELTRYNITQDWWSKQSSSLLKALSSKSPITVDLNGLERTDSAGLAWLINLVRDSKQQGFTVYFENIPDELNNLAKISDASTLLPLQ
jgi:phospholipid transport system transporter-binding protein